MKPITLTMKAFGSYGKNTVIDFDKFTNGLYIITGDTGAGKTTIFDAIKFALFGEASGNEREPGKVFHSDFVDKSVDTEVELKFSHDDRLYTVKRTLHFPKKRGKENEYGDADTNAYLTIHKEKEEVLEGAKKVSARITEIIGIDHEQFSKIVMLAQGEFKEFLRADSETKSNIIGKLFDNSKYVRYQNILCKTRDRLKAMREQDNKNIELAISGLAFPENMSEENRALFNGENTNILDDIQKMIDEDDAINQQEKAEKNELTKKKEKVIEAKQVAKNNNDILNDRKQAEEKLQTLKERADEMRSLEERYEKALKVVYNIVPAFERYQEKERAFDQCNSEYEKCRNAADLLKEAYVKAQTEKEANAERTKLSDTKKIRLAQLQELIEDYNTLKELERKAKEDERNRQQLEGNVEEKKAQVTEQKSRIEQYNSLLFSFEGIDTKLMEIQNRYNDFEERKNRFAAPNGYIGKRDAILKKIDTKEALQGALKEATKQAKNTSDAYKLLYDRFIDGQAQILATELSREVHSKGSGICPVCRTEIKNAALLCLGGETEDVPDKEQVDRAKRTFDQAEEKRIDCANQLDMMKLQIEHDKSVLVDAVNLDWDWNAETEASHAGEEAALAETNQNSLESDADWAKAGKEHIWKMISAPDYLENLVKDIDEEINKIRQELTDTENRIQERDNTKKKLDAAHTQVKENTEELEKMEAELVSARAQSVASQTEYESKRKTFEGKENLETLKTEGTALLKEISALEKENKKAEEDFHRATEEKSQNEANLKKAKENLPQCKLDYEKARQQYHKSLQDNGYSADDEAQAESEFKEVVTVDGEMLCAESPWFNDVKNRIADYNNKLNITKMQVNELTEKTKDLQYTDLEGFDAQQKQLQLLLEQKEERIRNYDNRIDRNKEARNTILKYQSKRQKTDEAFVRLNKLADIAGGSTQEGGKLSFERYISGAIFKEILAMANIRFDHMCGGRYRLVHQISAYRANSKAGLDIAVEDTAKGTIRDSTSLSGGESFLASMALALGLSDVVKNRAGGIKIESLFIDEGFGTLDNEKLDLSIEVLKNLTKGNCLVGLISHVGPLENAISQKIVVKNTKTEGSAVSLYL